MLYLALSTKLGSEMITKNTASNSTLANGSSIISAKDRKTNWQAVKKYELCMSAENRWSIVSRRNEDYVFKKAPDCTSAANRHPLFSWAVVFLVCFVFFTLFFFFFFPSPFFSGHMKASKHNEGVAVHVKDGKICLTKEVCKLPETRMECHCWQ